MASDVYSFVWTVPVNGYQWVQSKVLEENGASDGKTHWVLTSGIGIGQTYMMKQYAPLTEFPALFRTFADLAAAADREAILRFANTYGSLGVSLPLDLSAEHKSGPMPFIWGETHKRWAAAIRAMRRAVTLWDWRVAADREKLSRHFRWQDAGFTNDGHGKAAGWRFSTEAESGVDWGPAIWGLGAGGLVAFVQQDHGLVKPDDVLMPAYLLVQRWVNSALEGHVTPNLLYDPKPGKPVLQIVPENLLSAMWLQFARAIEGDKEYRACKECGKWIELSHRQVDGRTKRREFCSDACKSKDYRKRKERAAQATTAKPTTPKKRRAAK
jgi:hypothetical protein